MSNTSLDTQDVMAAKRSPLSAIFKAKELGIFAGLVILIVFCAALALSVPIGLALGVSALSGLMFIAPDPELIILLPQAG